jgi:putative ABC transport system permease protein
MVLLRYKDSDNNFDKEILERDDVTSLINISETIKTFNKMLGSLDSVVLVLIVAAALLAFIVLYNLSNINISERKREIATLKVLGFYNNEVDNYITKENIILTCIGTILGLIFGTYLSHYIISTCEPDSLLFVRHVTLFSYIISSVITVIFTIIVNIITHYSLLKIDMIESLKNVE